LADLAAAPAAIDDASPTLADAPLWLSEDERALLASAVAEQLLPLLTGLQSLETPEAQQAQVQEYAFQLELVGNAFEHCGLNELLATINVILADASTCEEDAAHRAIPWLNWQLAVIDWLESPEDQARQQALLDALCDPQWPLAFQVEEVEPLRAELARLRIGVDPALKLLRKSQAQWQDVALDIAPDVLPAVLDGMLRQLPLNVAQLSASIQRLTQTGEADDIDAARRAAHALKGDANLVGLTGLAQMTHALEDILVQLARAPAPPGATLAGVLSEAGDCVETMAEYVLRQGPPPDDALDVLQNLLNWSNALLDGEVPGEPAAEVHVETRAAPEPAAVAATADGDGDGEREAGETLRTLVVAVPLLDELLRLSSETIVLTQQVAEQLRSINKDHGENAVQTRRAQILVNELDDLVSLRGAALSSARLQGASVDPLELDQYNELHVLARRLQETNTDERAFVGNIDSALSRLEDLMVAQERMQNDLQGSVLRTRMVPVSQVVPRFQRAVRIASRNLLKELDLQVIGADTQVDSEVIETIVDPLMHALRNAADHGIEDPERRQHLGKPSVGQLTLSFAQASGSIQISLQDDGRGLDYTAIRNKAVALGMLDGDALPDRTLLNRLILTPGFSTRSEATQMSGRGIGMDVIATRVRELKGRLRLHSEDDRGTRVEIVLPSTLVSAHVAVAWTGSTPAAWVSASFNRFVAVRGDEIHMDVDGWRVHRDDGEIGVIPLAALLEIELSAAIDRNTTYVAAECESAAGPVLILADRISEMRSVIVKSTGPYMPPLIGVRGAAVLGNGGIAPVIDLTELVQTTLESQNRLDFSAMLGNTPMRSRHAMVIDDSLSVRRSLSTLLVDAGFEATTAIDGLDAMRLIEQRLPDVLLVDMEMPRMNGLELTSYLRSREETQNLPVIMITSRSTERHREMAETAGVDGFLVKPYLDDEVLALVAATMAARAAM
jgi:chemotaxis protein histidine kinase CheA/CheY-like chemotaxis protein